MSARLVTAFVSRNWSLCRHLLVTPALVSRYRLSSLEEIKFHKPRRLHLLFTRIPRDWSASWPFDTLGQQQFAIKSPLLFFQFSKCSHKTQLLISNSKRDFFWFYKCIFITICTRFMFVLFCLCQCRLLLKQHLMAQFAKLFQTRSGC